MDAACRRRRDRGCGGGGVIAEWRRCIDCGCRFGLVARQSNPGLLAVRERCGVCRPVRNRALTAKRNRRWRQRRRDDGSAPIYAEAALTAASEARSHA